MLRRYDADGRFGIEMGHFGVLLHAALPVPSTLVTCMTKVLFDLSIHSYYSVLDRAV